MLRILYSDRFTVAAEILPWFLAWQCLYPLANVYQQLLVGLDDVRGYAAATVSGNVVTISLAVGLVHRFRVAGIGTAFVVGALLTGVRTTLRKRRHHGLAVPTSAGGIAAFALVSFAVVTVLITSTADFSPTGLGVRMAIATVYLIVLWFSLPASLRAEITEATRHRLAPKTSGNER